jgi:hypothetical protein
MTKLIEQEYIYFINPQHIQCYAKQERYLHLSTNQRGTEKCSFTPPHYYYVINMTTPAINQNFDYPYPIIYPHDAIDCLNSLETFNHFRLDETRFELHYKEETLVWETGDILAIILFSPNKAHEEVEVKIFSSIDSDTFSTKNTRTLPNLISNNLYYTLNEDQWERIQCNERGKCRNCINRFKELNGDDCWDGDYEELVR